MSTLPNAQNLTHELGFSDISYLAQFLRRGQTGTLLFDIISSQSIADTKRALNPENSDLLADISFRTSIENLEIVLTTEDPEYLINYKSIGISAATAFGDDNFNGLRAVLARDTTTGQYFLFLAGVTDKLTELPQAFITTEQYGFNYLQSYDLVQFLDIARSLPGGSDIANIQAFGHSLAYNVSAGANIYFQERDGVPIFSSVTAFQGYGLDFTPIFDGADGGFFDFLLDPLERLVEPLDWQTMAGADPIWKAVAERIQNGSNDPIFANFVNYNFGDDIVPQIQDRFGNNVFFEGIEHPREISISRFDAATGDIVTYSDTRDFPGYIADHGMWAVARALDLTENNDGTSADARLHPSLKGTLPSGFDPISSGPSEDVEVTPEFTSDGQTSGFRLDFSSDDGLIQDSFFMRAFYDENSDVATLGLDAVHQTTITNDSVTIFGYTDLLAQSVQPDLPESALKVKFNKPANLVSFDEAFSNPEVTVTNPDGTTAIVSLTESFSVDRRVELERHFANFAVGQLQNVDLGSVTPGTPIDPVTVSFQDLLKHPDFQTFMGGKDIDQVSHTGIVTARDGQKLVVVETVGVNGALQRAVVNVETDADGNLVTDAQGVAIVESASITYTTTLKSDDADPGQTDVDAEEISVVQTFTIGADGKISVKTVDLEVQQQVQTVGAIGSIFGSAIGRAIAPDNVFAEIGISTTLGTLGRNLGEEVGLHLFDDDGVAGVIGFENFFDDLGSEILSAGIGAISSVITGELIDALGLNGTAAEVFNATAGAVINQIATNVADIAANKPDVTLFTDVNLTMVGNALGSFLGTKLADEIISFDTIGGQIGASIGGSIGSFIGQPLPVIGPFIGSFVGRIIGGLIGSLFGGTPRSAADVVWNEATGEFEIANVWSRKGGSKDAARGLAGSVADSLNGVLQVIGGELINGAEVQAGTYGMRKKDFTYRPESTRDKHAITKRTRDAGELTNFGLYHGLSDFRIAGGDIYAKRAFYRTLDAADQNSFEAETLYGNLTIAADYRGYLQNSSAINALMAAEPGSAFTAGWTITLSRAIELGLHKRHEADWYGGWEQFLEDAGLTAANLVMGLSGNERVMTVVDGSGFVVGQLGDTIDSGSKDVIEGTAGNDTITLVHQSGTATGGVDVISDTTGLTINGGAADGSAYTIDVAAVVYGGGGNDVITGGDLGNELFGEAGDDVLTGGSKADWLFGGDGNDTLSADKAGGVSDGNYLAGGAGDDVLEGRGGSDWLEGGAGIDTLRGGAGDDVLAGGAGVDDVRGGSGNDQYILRTGDGADTLFDEGLDYTDPGTPQLGDLAQLIADRTSGVVLRNWSGGGAYVERGRAAGGADVLVLGPGIGLEDLLFVRGGTVTDPGTTAQDLVLKIIDGAPSNLTGEQVVMKNWFDPFHRIETLRLADGQEVGIGHFSSFIIGTDAAEVIVGTAGGDFIHAAGGDDQVFALFGNDLANGGAGNDVVDGGGDADVVLGADGDDMVSGGLGTDTVSGGRGSDRLLGGGGNDILAGESGADWIAGGSGNDIIRYGRGDGHDVVLDDFAANTWQIAWISGPGFQSGYSLVAQPFDVDGDGVVEAGETRDTLEHDGRVIFDGARWLEWVYYDFDGSGGNPGGLPDGPAGTLYHLIDATVPLTADAGVDTLEFAIGIDVNDIHMAWHGTDLVLGIARPGEDVARFADLTDTVTLKEWGGAGAGAIERFAFFNTGLVDTTGITQWGGGSDGADTITGSLNRDWLTGNGGDDTVSGQGGDDILAGNAGFDVLDGGAGADVLLGGTGNDTLIGGAGGDVLVGGGGFDAASYEGATTGIVASLNDATTNTGEASGDSYAGVEHLIGSDHADTLEGDGGANELTGGLGGDTLRGLGGDDSYLYELGDGADTITDTSGEDTILFGAGIALSDLSFAMAGADLVITVAAGDTVTVTDFATAATKVETLQFADGLSVNLAGLVLGTAGTGGDDLVVGGGSLTGGDGADTLLGGSGADTLTGGLGDDQLDGGAGGDALAGGDGVDAAVYTGSAAGVVVDLGDGLAESGGDAAGDTLVGIEHVLGSAHADTLTGDVGDNVLKGNAGNDTIDGVAGANVLIGDGGDDAINGGTGEDNIDGGTGIDTIHGLGAADIINGGDGGDLLYGGLGDDTVIGGAGDDTIEGNDGADTLAGGDGADTLDGGAGNDTLDGGAGNDSLAGGAGDDRYIFTASSGQDTVVAGGGLDEVVFDGSVTAEQLSFARAGAGLADLVITVAGGGAAITIAGWFTDDANKVRRFSTPTGLLSRFDLDRLFDAGAASLAFADLTGLWQDAALYEDRAIVTGTAGNDTITIDPNYVGGQTLIGLDGRDTITGGAHNDVLIGGDGADTMDGGAGDDTFLNASDASRDHITGGAGYDRIVATVAGAQIRLDSVTGVEEITANGHGGVDIKNGIPSATFDFTDVLLDGIDWIILGSGHDTLFGSAVADRVTGDNGNDVVHGGLGNDTIFLGNGTDTGYGDAGDDYLSGGKGDDSLFGGAGNDTLAGGEGFDTLDGGAGIDTADYSNRTVGTTIHLHDAVFGSGHAYDQQELISNIENVIGTQAADTIWGDDGANRLDGGKGDDTLHGGLGDDSFVLEAGVDSLDGGDGVDTVDYSAATTTLTVDLSLGTATVGGVTDTLASIEAVIGGSGDDSLIGSGAGELFTGGAGNDTIDGGGGSDVAVFAGLRADYVVDTATGTITHTPTGDVDTFTRIETLRFADTDVSLGINPNNRPDVLSPIPSQSLRETDTLSFQIPGSAFGDQDSDPLSYVASLAGGAALPAWLAFDQQTGLFSGTPAVGDRATLTIEVKAFDGQAFSDPSAFTIEVLVKGAVIAGTPTAETLTGGDGHDAISGLGGDDTLIGLVGRDELDGGAGADTADYAASPEAVSVNLATGATSGGHAAGDSYVSIENLTGSEFADTLRGDAAANLLRGLGAGDQLHGAGGDDRLEGGAGDDSLFGDDGADTLIGGTGTNSVTGGLGDDTIIGGAGADTVDGGTGSDTMDYGASVAGITVDLSVGTAAGGDAANDSLTGIENVTGTAQADVLTGDGAANRLDGGAGDDTLSGGAGADVLIGGAGTDTVTYAAAGAGVTATLGGTGSQGAATGDQISGVERLIGSGFADTLTGDGAANTLHGGAGNDTLHGLGGVDHLYGQDGDDHLYGGAGGDFLYGGAGDDHIEAGSQGDHLDGGAGNDRLMGSTGNDTYHVGRTSGHDVIDNYDQSGSLDRVVYANDVAYDSLWFERGDWDATTGVFTRNDTGGTELRVTVLGTTPATTSSVVVLDMFDATTGAMLDQYKVDLFIAGERQARDTIDVPQLLTLMQGYGTMPTGVDSVPASIKAGVDAAWGFNSPPDIVLTTPGVVANDVHVAEDTTLTLTFDVADLNAQGQVETPADALVVTARTSGSLFPAEIIATVVDADTRQIVLDPNQFASGTETITVEVSDGGITTPLQLTVTVDAVAATPSLTIADPTLATNAGAAIALGISASLGGGGDPSETLEVDITGWPAGAAFSAGADQGNGVWRVTAAQLAGLTITPPAGAGTDITLSVVARAREAGDVSTAVSAARTIAIAVNGTPTDVRVKHQTNPNQDITASLGIPEITAGAIVGNLDAVDPDNNEPGGDAFTYAIVAGGGAANFEIVGNQLKLKDTVSLDHETAADATQNITVRATDQGGLSFDKALTITVTDVDEKPSQPTALTPVNLAENDPNLSVTLTGATDPEGHDVDYSFRLVGGASGNTGGLFTITNDATNTATLALNNDTPLDFEFLEGQSYFTPTTATRGYLQVEFLATDTNVTDPDANFDDAHKSATQTLRLYVDDINEAPTTPTATWQRTTPVNEHTAAHIATLTATDPDGDTLTYKVTHNAGYFEIRHGNQLWTKTNIDYEALTGSALQAHVKADDGPLDSVTPWAKSITIANTNDNNPEFTNGTDNASGVDQYPATSVNENTPVNTWLGPKFLASDPDGGSLSYAITGGNTGNAFDIAHYQDGARLKIANGVDYETKTTYNLTLEVKDPGGRTDTANIQVNVNNVTEWQLIADFDNLPEAFAAPFQNTYEIIEIIGNGSNGIPHGYRYYSSHTFATPYTPHIFEKGITNTAENIDYIRLFSGNPSYSWTVISQHPAIRYDATTNEVFWNLDYVAPVVLDLDGDGIELVPAATSKITFDANSDGDKDITGWVGADDALLVLDRNGDGVIGDGSEISFVQDLPGATTDMEGLVAFDTNADGVFDGADARFGEFQLWQDANQNGVSEADELSSLAEAGIAGIDLALTPTGETMEGARDNVIVNTAEFVRADGTTGLVGDAMFAYVPGTPAAAASAPTVDEAVARLVQAMAAFDPAPSAAFDRRDRDVRPRPLSLAVSDHV